MSLLLFASLLLNLAAPAYTAVVVDARTNQPLVGVNVQDYSVALPIMPLVTDATGRFSVYQAPVHVQLRMLGYTPLEVTRTAHSPANPDTLRLQPQALVLAEVAVKPGKAAILSTTSAKADKMARRILPGQSVAMQVLPPAGSACLLNEVRLYLQDKPKEGRLRLRLVNVLAGTAPGNAVLPGLADLLPEPVIYSASQLADMPHGRVTLDLSKYGLQIPAEGLCVVVDCLPTDPADKPIAVTKPANGRGGLKVVLAPNPNDLTTAHTLDADKFPVLEGQRSGGTSATWARSTSKPDWRPSGPGSSNIRAELNVFVY
jgi:hypothetical protein